MKTPWWGYILAVVLSVAPAFFIVFNAIFSDIFTPGDRLLSFLLVVLAYEGYGFILGYIWPATGWRWGLWISATAAALVIFYSIGEGQYLLHLVYILLTVGAACNGSYWGQRVKGKKMKGKLPA
ncbi:MAG TPA: hypothetical protein PLY40_01710 [Bacillota bacterium]|nr:hypothetical protein [Bacillota bacterium]